MKFTISIKTIFKVLAIGINKAWLFILGAVAILLVTAPYIHIFVNKASGGNIFGFNSMRNFLYAIGLPLSLFCCSLFLLFSVQYMGENSPKKYFYRVGFLFLSSSFFQFIWIFWERHDFSKATYFLIVSGLSIVISFSFVKGIVDRKNTVIKLQSALNALSKFSFITVKKHIPLENKEEYKTDLINALKEGMTND